MTHTHTQDGVETIESTWITEQVILTRQRADRVWDRARAAQRSAADSLERSAQSHERVANSYEITAESSERPDKWRKHAACHREFAQEDHRMAERLRRMAGGGNARGPQTGATSLGNIAVSAAATQS